MLVTGSPASNMNVNAKKHHHHLTDPEREDSVGIDVNGVPCIFGPFHDQCQTPG
jgi:hypothetical protein